MEDMTDERSDFLDSKLRELFMTHKVTTLEAMSMGFMILQETRQKMINKGLSPEKIDNILDKACANVKTGDWTYREEDMG